MSFISFDVIDLLNVSLNIFPGEILSTLNNAYVFVSRLLIFSLVCSRLPGVFIYSSFQATESKEIYRRYSKIQHMTDTLYKSKVDIVNFHL